MSSPSTTPDRDKGPDEVFCRDCGRAISERAEICPECGVRQHAPPTQFSDALEGGNPFLAAVLSAFIPGVGQIYNRELERGLAFIVASVVSGFLVLFGIGLLVYPLVWMYSIYDAYTRAERVHDTRRASTGTGPSEYDARDRRDPEAESETDEWGAGSRPDSDDATGPNRR